MCFASAFAHVCWQLFDQHSLQNIQSAKRGPRFMSEFITHSRRGPCRHSQLHNINHCFFYPPLDVSFCKNVSSCISFLNYVFTISPRSRQSRPILRIRVTFHFLALRYQSVQDLDFCSISAISWLFNDFRRGANIFAIRKKRAQFD